MEDYRMDDPLSALKLSLQPIFHFEPKRHGDYTHPAVQQLEYAINDYDPNSKQSFLSLIKTIKAAMPQIEKWRVNFEIIKKSMDVFAQKHDMTLDWNRVLSQTKISSKFHFKALNHRKKEDDLVHWLNAKTGQKITTLTCTEQTNILLSFKDKQGFNKKLTHYLKNNPNFLFDLIIDSIENFEKISKSVLICQLTDTQLATTIIQYIPCLIDPKKEGYEQVEHLINTLNNKILSHGRSVSTILRTTDAVPILMTSEYIKSFQSEGYKKRHQNPSFTPAP